MPFPVMHQLMGTKSASLCKRDTPSSLLSPKFDCWCAGVVVVEMWNELKWGGGIVN